MKLKKNSKKVHKNKLFRKRAYKTYKRGHSIHRIRRSSQCLAMLLHLHARICARIRSGNWSPRRSRSSQEVLGPSKS